MDGIQRADYSSTPYGAFVEAMNMITDRWSSVSARVDYTTPKFQTTVDPQIQAVNDFMSGKVPQQGSNIEELVTKFVV